MNITEKIKDIYMKKKKLIVSTAILAAFLATIVFVIITNTGKVQAVSETVSDSSYELTTDNLDLTMMVSNGTYTIVGNGTQKNNISINIKPTSEAVTDVTIVLDNVKITTDQDKAILSLNPSASGVTCNYTLVVKGKCQLEAVSNSQTYTHALIEVQKVNTSLISLSESELVARYAKLSDLLTDVEASYETTLTITDDGQPGEDALGLVTGSSFGAAIGSGKAELPVNVPLSAGKPSTTFSPYYYLDENGNDIGRHSAYDYLNEKYGTNYTDSTVLQLGKQFFVDSSVNAGNVTIDGDLELYIENRGYGAGIGGGASQSVTRPSGSAGVVTINNGSVAISTETNAPCIGTGINYLAGPVGNGNRIIVNGGSLYMSPATMYDGDIVNSENKKLYLFKLDLTDKGGFNNDWSGQVNIEDGKYSNTYTGNFTIASEHATATIDSSDYTYEGIGYKNTDLAYMGTNLRNRLYFYLPATPTSELTISGGSYISAGQKIEVYQNDELVNPQDATNHKYVVSANSMVDVRIYDVRDELAVSYVSVGSQRYPVTKVTDTTGTYYIASFKMPESATTVSVSYEGEIPIIYNDGFVDTDSSDHGYVAPVVNVYTYGSDIVLANPTIDDLTFDGWYVTGTDTPVSSVTSDDIISGDILTDGAINVTARWNCTVTYDYYIEEGNSGIIKTDSLTYGTSFTLDPNDNGLPTPPTIDYYDFVGWSANGAVYKPGEPYTYFVNALTNNITIKAEYKKNRFYIYVDKEFFDATQASLIIGNNSVSFDTEEFVVDGITYYRVLIEDAVSEVTLNIAAKLGYEISALDWSVSISNAASFTDSWSDNSVAYTLGIDSKDIYVKNNHSSFVPKEYTITFFDGVNTESSWKQITYTIEDFQFPATLTEILGQNAIEINTRYDRYHKFTGWKANTALGQMDPYVTQIDALGNYIFVGNWEETAKYPLNITVHNSENNQLSQNVAIVPYLYDETYNSKTPIPVVEVTDESTGEISRYTYVIPGDKVFFEFVALDDEGNFIVDAQGKYKVVEIGEGIEFAIADEEPYDYCIKYDYTSIVLEDTIKKIKVEKQFITIPDDVLDESPINIDIRIKLSRFSIQYWDLRGYTNTNPVTYTVFDEFQFNNLVSGVGWVLVVQDNDETNFDEVTTTPITGVSKWSSGNMVVKPAWPSETNALYNITIQLPDGTKGNVQVVYPTDATQYTETQTIFLSVTSIKGYKLVANSLVYTRVENAPLVQHTFSRFALSRETTQLPQVILPINEANGMYLFMMPGSDIVINAEFEPEVYNIVYNDIDENITNNNPTTYTIEDEIVLTVPVKDGYDFKGWMDNNGNIVTNLTGMTGNIELTPSWQKKADEETTTKPEESTSENKGDINQKPNDNNTNEETTTIKQQYIGGNSQSGSGMVQTNDKTNITKLVLICVIAAVLLLIAVVKKKDSSNDEENDEDIDIKQDKK